MNLNALKPVGLHVTGVIRFAMAQRGTVDERMLDHFDVLGRSYHAPAATGEVPALKAHPIATKLAQVSGHQELREIPITLLFERIENNLSARFEAYDSNLNRVACVGDGARCARADHVRQTVNVEPCAGPDACAFANANGVRCQLRVRLALQIDGQDDPLSVFEFQSGGIHTYRNLASKLSTLQALVGRVRGVPLTIRSYERTAPAHGWQSFQVADLVLRPGADLASLATTVPEGPLGPRLDALEDMVEAMHRASPFVLGNDVEEGGRQDVPRSVGLEPLLPLRQTGAQLNSIEAVVQAAQAAAAVNERLHAGALPTTDDGGASRAMVERQGDSLALQLMPDGIDVPGAPIYAAAEFLASPLDDAAVLTPAKISPVLELPPTPI